MKKTTISSSKSITYNGDITAEKCNGDYKFSITISNLTLSANTYTVLCIMNESKSAWKTSPCIFFNAANTAVVGYGVLVYNSGTISVICNTALGGGRMSANFMI